MLSFFRLSFIFFVFLTSLYPTFPLKSDQVHIPSYVFEDHPSGQKALNPARATNASLVHLDGIKGRTKAGKRLLAAVIDSSINTALPHMKELREKGLFHPAALEPNNPYMVNPNEAEEFDKYDKLVKDH